MKPVRAAGGRFILCGKQNGKKKKELLAPTRGGMFPPACFDQGNFNLSLKTCTTLCSLILFTSTPSQNTCGIFTCCVEIFAFCSAVMKPWLLI